MFSFRKAVRRYDEDDGYYESDADEEEALDLAGEEMARPKSLKLADYLIAAGLGLFAFLVLSSCTPDALSPDVWNDCVEAAGLRPPRTLIPGLWRIVGVLIYKWMGVAAGNATVVCLGRVVLGGVVALVYLLFRDMLSILVRPPAEEKLWNKYLSRATSGVGALLFLAADPVWTLGYSFGRTLMLVAIFTLAVFLLAHFLASGTIVSSYLAMFVLGVLCAETPLGLILLVLFWTLFYSLLNSGSLFHVQLLEPLRQQSSKWYLTFLWAAGFLLAVAANIIGFKAMGGLEGAGMDAGAIPVEYARCLWYALAYCASTGGWIVGFGAVAVPFVLALALLRRAADLERFLSYHAGLVFLVIGAIAYSQLCSLQPLWFWSMQEYAFRVSSPLLLYLCSLMSATTVLCAITVVVVEVFCRDHARLAEQINSDIDARSLHVGMALFSRVALCSLAAVLLVAGTVPGRLQRQTRDMLATINRYIDEIVAESDGAKWLFTDGAFDCAIELRAAEKGRNLYCLSLNPGPGRRSLASVKETLPDAEDKLSADIGEPNLLRTWQRDKPERMKESAMMLGLELWRVRGGVDYPPIGGVLSRTQWPEGLFERSIAAGKELRDEVMAFQEKTGGPKPIAGERLKDLYYIMQWRLARLARLRSELYDRAGDVGNAAAERAYSDKLDDKNHELKRLSARIAKIREHTMRQMPPREGLHLALVRADFILARRFAESVIEAAPDSIDANFAMGMSYYVQGQLSMAEQYLKKCTVLKPVEPTFWNNLAMVQKDLGHYDDALDSARKALALIPRSAEVKDTIRQIEDAKKAGEEAKVKSAAENPAKAR